MRTQLVILSLALVLCATYIMASNNNDLDVDMDLMSEQSYDSYYSNARFSLMATAPAKNGSSAFSNTQVSSVSLLFFMALSALIALFIKA